MTSRIVDGGVGGREGVPWGWGHIGNKVIPNTQGLRFTGAGRSRVHEITHVNKISSGPAITSSNSRSGAVGTLGGPVSLGTLVSR